MLYNCCLLTLPAVVAYFAVEMLCSQLPEKYAAHLLKCLAGLTEDSRHLQFYLTWAVALLQTHSRIFKERSTALMPSLQSLHKAISQRHDDIAKL